MDEEGGKALTSAPKSPKGDFLLYPILSHVE
jgi:hypothetical protein